MYYGVVLNEIVALKFAMENAPDLRSPSKFTKRMGKVALRVVQLPKRDGKREFSRILRTNEKM
jgi:hypothetical protein